MVKREDELLREKVTALCFQTLVPLKDTLSLIVTSHLFVEFWLDWLIRASIPKPEKLLDNGRLTFAQKLALAESLGLLDAKVAEAIQLLNNIRNKVSHNLVYKGAQKDLQLLAKLISNLSNEEQLISKKLKSPKKELVFFCTYFAGYAVGFVRGRTDALEAPE